jgi:hypothetical protein
MEGRAQNNKTDAATITHRRGDTVSNAHDGVHNRLHGPNARVRFDTLKADEYATAAVGRVMPERRSVKVTFWIDRPCTRSMLTIAV